MTSTTKWAYGRRTVEPGWLIHFKDHRGWYRFVQHVTGATGAEWLDVVGPEANPRSRSFHPRDVNGVKAPARTKIAKTRTTR